MSSAGFAWEKISQLNLTDSLLDQIGLYQSIRTECMSHSHTSHASGFRSLHSMACILNDHTLTRHHFELLCSGQKNVRSWFLVFDMVRTCHRIPSFQRQTDLCHVGFNLDHVRT